MSYNNERETPSGFTWILRLTDRLNSVKSGKDFRVEMAWKLTPKWSCNSQHADNIQRKATYSSDEFEHLIPMHIVHCDDGVEGSIAHSIVTVTYVNRYLL